MAFYNRSREIDFLAGQARDDQPCLVVLYGRRRIGKTSLLKHFAADRRSVIFVADQESRSGQLAAFSRVLFGALEEPGLSEASFPSWESALRHVGSRAGSEPLLLVLDEFGYLCQSDPALPSVLQRLWDGELCRTRLHLVLCGSYVSFMEREILGATNPLYGRRTGEWLLDPFLFRDARDFFPRRRADEQVTLFGVFGGIPAYLERIDPGLAVSDNIIASVLSRGAALYNEPRFLMMEELRDPNIYFSVCRAVAFGSTTPNEIAQAAGLPDRGAVSRYLEVLREMRILERRTPVTERNPEKTRRGRWRLCDPFFRFWFRFVLPNRSSLEAGDPAEVYLSKVAPHLEQHVSLAFEEVCAQHLWHLNRSGALPARFDRVGGWWRGDAEVDLAAVSDQGRLLLGECKWSKNAVGMDVLEKLLSLAPAVAKEARAEAPILALWSRAGFTPALRQRAENEKVLLFGLGALAGPDAEEK